ncbi:unnamed protein product [Penicillium discolor]
MTWSSSILSTHYQISPLTPRSQQRVEYASSGLANENGTQLQRRDTHTSGEREDAQASKFDVLFLMGSMNKDSAFRLLGAFYEAGGNSIDIANIYQNEQSEEWIGEWAEASQNRDSLVLATKFTMDYRSHAIGKGPRAANFAGNSRHIIHVSVRDSLKKLRTDPASRIISSPQTRMLLVRHS